MAEGYLLSNSDRVLISRLLDWARSGRINTQNLPEDDSLEHEEMSTPDIYVAIIPSSGIPAVQMSGSIPSTGDIISSAICSIYQAVQLGTAVDILELRPLIGNYTRRVYNLGLTDLTGDQWALVKRDKFGNWFVEAVTSGDITIVPGTGTSCTLTVQDTYGSVAVLDVCTLQFCYEHFTVAEVIPGVAEVCWRHHPDTNPQDYPCNYVYRRNRLYFCIAERWQVWEQLWRVGVDTNGCPTEELVATYFVGYEGCCPCDTTPPGTGTVCVPGTCDLCTDPPRKWIVTVFSFEGLCAKFNGVWQLDSVSNCIWDNSLSYTCISTDPHHCVSVTLSLGANSARLVFTDGVTTATYTAHFDGNCCHPLTFVPGTTQGTGSPESCGCEDSPQPSGTAVVGDCDFCTGVSNGRTPSSFTNSNFRGNGCYLPFDGIWTFDISNGCVYSASGVTGAILITLTIQPDGVVWVKFSNGSAASLVYSTILPIKDCCTPFSVFLIQQGCPGSHGVPNSILRIDPSCSPAPPPDDNDGGSCSPAITAVPDCCSGGTEACSPIQCWLCPHDTPVQWHIHPSGFADDCAVLNNVFNLDPIAPCMWASAGVGTVTATLELVHVLGSPSYDLLRLTLRTFQNGTLYTSVYESVFTGDCCDIHDVIKVSSNCTTSPSYVRLYPECCAMGTGSGSGTGSGTGTAAAQWWCTNDNGVIGCVLAFEAPDSDDTRGPYADFDTCRNACETETGTGTGTGGGGGTIVPCCPGNAFPETVKATFSDGNGQCACAVGSVNLTYNPSAGVGSGGWVGSTTICGQSVTLTWYCATSGTVASDMRLTVDFGAGACVDCPNSPPDPSANCAAFTNFTYICGQGATSCCTGAFGAIQFNITPV